MRHLGGVSDDTDTSLFDLLDSNFRRLLVESDSEPFELVLNNLFVLHRLGCIEDDQNEVASSGDGDDLLTSTDIILSSLDNSREIQELELGSLVTEDTRNASHSGEFVGGGFRFFPSKLKLLGCI